MVAAVMKGMEKSVRSRIRRYVVLYIKTKIIPQGIPIQYIILVFAVPVKGIFHSVCCRLKYF